MLIKEIKADKEYSNNKTLFNIKRMRKKKKIKMKIR